MIFYFFNADKWQMLVQSANYPKGEMYANARGMRDQINNE